MATVVLNSPDIIQFANIGEKPNKLDPTLILQAGDWQNGGSVDTGIVFDVTGQEAPILTADNARKLAKWLQRAADMLDGVKPNAKKKHRFSYDEDDDGADDFPRRH